MLNYSSQLVREAFDGVTLTTGFADNRYSTEVGGMSKLSLDIDYTRGATEASSKLQMQIEHSTDNVNWYSLVIDETSTVSTITPRVWELEGTNKVNIILDIAYKNIRISVKESGAVTNAGTVSIGYVVSGL